AYEKLSVENLNYMEKIQPQAIFISGFMMGVHPAEEAIFEVIPKWKGKAKIYFDPNLRYPPDATPPEVKKSMQRMSELSDVVLSGYSEMRALDLKPRKGQTFIVKKGKEGSYLLNEDGGEEFYVLPTEHIAVDATGAGDAYAAAYVYAETAGLDVRNAMKFATVAAGFSVTVQGARSMPTKQTIDNYINGENGER
ncbi:MAG: PfkB family carbohydrate kinase, partial [Oscillospiraceae bacterium]